MYGNIGANNKSNIKMCVVLFDIIYHIFISHSKFVYIIIYVIVLIIKFLITGRIVRIKSAPNEKGQVYGWTKKGRFSFKKRGFFPLTNVSVTSIK